MNKLRIAQVSSLIERVPPKKYGGLERVVHALTEELVKKGHDVTLFASGDSITSAKLVPTHPRSLREARLKDAYGLSDATLFNVGLAYKMQDEFDIIHDHNGIVSLPTANLARTPVIMTLHGPFTPSNRHVYQTLRRPRLITISQAQGSFAPAISVAGTIYNGLYLDDYPFSANHDGYLLFVGRISMEKGTHHAIEVAQELNLPLVIAAKLDAVDLPYFNEYVGPRLSEEQIRWVGEVDQQERNHLMSRALCMLHPVTWHEPFGLTLIEAMACGCPVIAFDKGSISEVIQHGQTGFVVSHINEMIDAVGEIDRLSRPDCRRYVLEKFNAARMADQYEAHYYQILTSA